jgi:hypothetical protein
VRAIEDTYIEAGAEAAVEHGTRATLDVDQSPVDIAYLKFDLRNVGTPVTQATLTLACTNGAADGGTLYPVGNSDWTEGTGSGGAGLRWNDVDTNRDGRITGSDGSPYVPDLNRPLAVLGAVAVGDTVTVDVTAAFQDGPGLYTLAIRNDSTNGASYTTREGVTAKRPLLRLQLETCTSNGDCDDGRFCNGREVCTAGRCEPGNPAVCDDGISCTVDACVEASDSCIYTPDDTRCDDGAGCTVDTCDPDAGCQSSPDPACHPMLVADTYIEARTEKIWDHGASDHLDVDVSPFGITYLKFDLSGVAGPVTSAVLELWCSNSSSDGGTIYPVHRSDWIEGNGTGIDGSSTGGPGLKWTDVDINGDGAVDARDASPWVPDLTRPIATLGSVRAGVRASVDVTNAFQDGPRLYTLAIRSGSADGATFSSRTHAVTAQRPRLRLSSGP